MTPQEKARLLRIRAQALQDRIQAEQAANTAVERADQLGRESEARAARAAELAAGRSDIEANIQRRQERQRAPESAVRAMAATAPGAAAAPSDPAHDVIGAFVPQAEGDNTARDAARAFGQGLTFGFGDEATSAADATLGWLMGGEGRSWGDRYDAALAETRGNIDRFREENPWLAYGAEIAGALPTALGTAPLSIARAGVPIARTTFGPMIERTMRRPGFVNRVARGLFGGGLSGGLYGFGQGEGDFGGRLQAAAMPAAVGAGAGMVAPAVGVAGKALGERRAIGKAAKKGGVPREAVEPMQEMLDVDTGFGAKAVDLEPGAVAADSGPAARSLLDKAMAVTGKAAAPARREIDRRAQDASEALRTALDDTLGTPKGLRVMESQMRGRSDPLDAVFGTGGAGDDIRLVYDAAYATPIDYASETGQALEQVLRGQVPFKAIKEANELMRLRGEHSRQILAHVGDDGRIVYERMPDVREIDYITRGMNQMAETQRGKGAMGKQTPKGMSMEQVSGQIRGLLRESVPEYGRALGMAAEPIRARQAAKLGQSALATRMTMDEFADQLRQFPEGSMERRFVAQGMRDHIDETMARAKDSLIPSPNVSGYVSRPASADIEGVKALKELSSRAARTKIAAVIGKDESQKLFDELDRTADAFELKNTMLLNLRKVADKSLADQRGRYEAGTTAALRRGEPVQAAKTAAATLMGRGPEDELLRQDATAEAVVNALLGRTTPERLNALVAAERRQPAGRRAARLVESLVGRGALAATPTLPDLPQELWR